jgi:tetratricopeptide (TPR) repeat protein
LLTPHSRALSDLDPAAEPPDGSFDHAPSGRSYRVYRQDNQLRHQEILRTEDGKEIGRVDLPVRYLVGSGHFSRTYIVEVDGFLHESPITWYAARKSWGLSPGYDHPRHASFERPILADCLACHSGRVEETDGSLHRLTIHEKAIGCENCHGPGSLHQDLHRSGKYVQGTDDLTIVHPGKLPRSLREDVCAACHQSALATVLVRGRPFSDFRPGRPLTDYRIHYRIEGGSRPMTVVGHVEQLRRSACYQKSEDLTCLTCHDPHQRARPVDRTAYYRQKCLDCHAGRPCGLDEARRQKEAGDNCASCHMPRGDTEIPHIAFTHHRIGLHPPRPPAAVGAPELVPEEDNDNLTALDRERNLGLAYLEARRKPALAAYARLFQERAVQHLEAVRAAGLRDGTTAVGLAEIAWDRDRPLATAMARQALEEESDAPPARRAMALMMLAYGEAQDGNFEPALGPLEERIRINRFADDWRFLSQCYRSQGQPRKALAALQQALAIRPYRAHIHQELAEVYYLLGDSQKAAEHREKALWLKSRSQD